MSRTGQGRDDRGGGSRPASRVDGLLGATPTGYRRSGPRRLTTPCLIALALVGCGSERASDVGDPAREPVTTELAIEARPSPARPDRPASSTPRPTTLRVANRTGAAIELFAGRPVDHEDLLPYLDLTVEADGVDGAMRLEGAETAICPERTLAALGSPSRRPPCRNPECLLTLGPGESIELLWNGWLLRPNDARDEPRDEVRCFHRRAPLPLEHQLVLCGHLQNPPGGQVCARARTALPTDADIVLAFGADASTTQGDHAN